MYKGFKIIWKVHSKNFDKFMVYIDNYYDKYNYYYLKYSRTKQDMLNLYKDNSCDYLLIGLATSYFGSKDIIVSSEVYSNSLCDYAISVADWEYQGEYNGRKEKLKRLNDLSK